MKVAFEKTITVLTYTVLVICVLFASIVVSLIFLAFLPFIVGYYAFKTIMEGLKKYDCTDDSDVEEDQPDDE